MYGIEKDLKPSACRTREGTSGRSTVAAHIQTDVGFRCHRVPVVILDAGRGWAWIVRYMSRYWLTNGRLNRRRAAVDRRLHRRPPLPDSREVIWVVIGDVTEALRGHTRCRDGRPDRRARHQSPTTHQPARSRPQSPAVPRLHLAGCHEPNVDGWNANKHDGSGVRDPQPARRRSLACPHVGAGVHRFDDQGVGLARCSGDGRRRVPFPVAWPAVPTGSPVEGRPRRSRMGPNRCRGPSRTRPTGHRHRAAPRRADQRRVGRTSPTARQQPR